MIETALSHPEVIISSGCGDKTISARGNISPAGYRVKSRIQRDSYETKKQLLTSVRGSFEQLHFM